MSSGKIEATIVFQDDFEYGATPTLDTNSNPINGGWTASFNPSNNWSVAGASPVLLTDQYSFIGSNPQTYIGGHSGNIAVAFAPSSNITLGTVAMGTLSTPIPTTVGTNYNLSFWISNPTAGGAMDNLFSVSWNNVLLNLSDSNVNLVSSSNFSTPNGGPGQLPGTAGQYVVTPNTNWFQVIINNLPAASSGNSTNLTFSGQNNSWATLVDDVIVQDTPEPSTEVLLGIGTVLAGMRRRRQQRS
jgi:hypothetical protein